MNKMLDRTGRTGRKRLGIVAGAVILVLVLFVTFRTNHRIAPAVSVEQNLRAPIAATLIQTVPNISTPSAQTPLSPAWAVAYGDEFWRIQTPAPTNLSLNAPTVNVHEVIDRVSHAFRVTTNN